MSSISLPLFTQLVRRLRHTNALYHQIARQCRRTYRPTHHAKRRAFRAGLYIDTAKARGTCFEWSVSPTPPPVCLSPLALGPVLGYPEPAREPVPGAPRMRPKPLPEAESVMRSLKRKLEEGEEEEEEAL